MTTTSKLFTGLNPEQLRLAESLGEARQYAAGQTIVREGEAGDTMFLVLTGKIGISKVSPSGAQVALGNLGPGDYLGEMSVVDAQPRSATAIAAEPVTVRVLKRVDLDKLSVAAPLVMFNLLKGSGGRLRAMNDQFITRVKMALVGDMAGTIVHDFKNPMTIIRMNAELLGRAGANPKQCETIIRNVDRITYMVNDLLDYSRGTIHLNRREVDPAKWLAELTELLEPLSTRKGVQFQTSISATNPLWVDPDKLMRAVYNLASNGIDAMPEGGTLMCKISPKDKGCLLEVIDTGGGIPEQIRDRLFDDFVTFGKAGGTGLGTSIAKKIVEEHGGTISFTTATGKGTTFHITLPSKPAA